MTRSPTFTVTLLSEVLDCEASWNQFTPALSCAAIVGPVGVLVGVAVTVAVGVAVAVDVGVGVAVPVTTTSPDIASPWASQKKV